MPWLVLSIILVLATVVLFFLASRQRRQAGIPAGKVIYIDTSQWGKVEKPLYDPDLHLTGRPDYLVRQGRQVIPVEDKSSRAPLAPYDSHIYQVAAYCMLVEHAYGSRPHHGLIHYADKSFAIEFTQELEATVKAIIRQLQGRQIPSDRSHQDAQRCKHCGYRSICEQSLRI